MILYLVFICFLSELFCDTSSEWGQYLKDSHLNNFIDVKFSDTEWVVGNITGVVWGAPLIDSERNTLVFLFFDSSTYEDVIVEIDIDSGKIVTYKEVRKYGGATQDEGYGGLLSKNGQFVWLYGISKSNELKAYVMNDQKVMDWSGLVASSGQLGFGDMLYVLKYENVIYLQESFVCGGNDTYPKKCNVMVSEKIGDSHPDWITNDIRCDSGACKLTLAENGIIYLMNDYTTEPTEKQELYPNTISIFDSNSGEQLEVVELDSSIREFSEHISVSNIGPLQYYFISYQKAGYFDVKATLWAYDRKTNKLSWKTEIPGHFGSWGSKVTISPDGNNVGFVMYNDTESSFVFVFDAKTGDLKVKSSVLSELTDIGNCGQLYFMKNGNLMVTCLYLPGDGFTVMTMDEEGKKVLERDDVGNNAISIHPVVHDANGNVYYCWNNHAEQELKTITTCKKKSF